jgi:hypothetical protein
MVTTYTSTIEVNVWKEHTCCACGSVFRYLFKRKKQGQGGSPEKARAAAQKAAVKALEHEVDMHPCPGCGLYQPDMVGSRKARRHGFTALAALVILVPMLILYATDVLSAATTMLLTVGLCALTVLAHLLIDSANPNKDLEANQHLAQMRVEKGDLWVPGDRPRNPEMDPAAAGSGWTSSHTTAYAMLALGLVAFLTPEMFRALRGWPVNAEWVPVVAGPGDDPYIYFTDKITSVKGFWKGTPEITVTNAQELGLPNPRLAGTSKVSSWNEKISIGSKESKTSTNTLWARVQLPADNRLEGKTLQLEIKMNVDFPMLQNANTWIPATYHVLPQHKTIRLATQKAGSQYQTWWWSGFLGGAFLMLVPGFVLMRLSKAMRRRAHPTSIFVPEQAQAQEQVVDVEAVDEQVADGQPAPGAPSAEGVRRAVDEPPPLP